jgi:uncharacterized membrane protein YjgN (DUF898 family)
VSAPQFDIVFRGLRKGVDADFAKAQFATLFKLDKARTDRIFRSKNVTLKNHADERLANIFIARLFAIGVVADKLPVECPPSKAIYTHDSGETSTESCAMHQPVEYLYGEHTRRIPFIFTGTGFGYFKLWLVNILVCVLSAGILYPWTRVRSLRYFYQHTHLDGENFHYTSSSPKMFLIQFLLILYVLGLACAFVIKPVYGAVGAIILLACLPFYWSSSSKFQRQHTFYCDTSFEQKSNLRDAYLAFLGLPLLVILSGGLAVPYAAYNIHRYRASVITIGGNAFVFAGKLKCYFSLLPSLLFAECVTFLSLYYHQSLPLGFISLLIVCLWLWMFIRWRVLLTNLQWNAVTTRFGYFLATCDVPGYNKLVTSNLLLCLLTLGFYWPWAVVKLAQYKASHLAFFANQRFKKWRRTVESV